VFSSVVYCSLTYFIRCNITTPHESHSNQLVKTLPITQGQDGIHRIVFPASSPRSTSPSSPHRSPKPRHSVRPQRVYTGANMASLKKLPRESMFVCSFMMFLPALIGRVFDAFASVKQQFTIQFTFMPCVPTTFSPHALAPASVTRSCTRTCAVASSNSRKSHEMWAGASAVPPPHQTPHLEIIIFHSSCPCRGTKLLISLARPYTAASTVGLASRSSISHRESSSHLSNYEACSGPSPRASQGLQADHDAATAAAAVESSCSDYAQMNSHSGGTGALSRPLTARVSIYAPAPALKKQYTSSKLSSPGSTCTTSPKSPSASSCRTITDDSTVAVHAPISATTAQRAATSHGDATSPPPNADYIDASLTSHSGSPSPRVRTIRVAATPEKGNERPRSSPSAVAAKAKCEPLRSFTADPAFHAAAAAVAAAAEQRKANPPFANAQGSRALNSRGASGGGKLLERAKSSGDDATAPPPPATAVQPPQAPSSATQSVAAAKSL
jgi:hypothetical protein